MPRKTTAAQPGSHPGRRCGGQVKIVAAVTEPGSIRTYLEGIGLPARAPPIAAARPDPQREFDLDYAASAA